MDKRSLTRKDLEEVIFGLKEWVDDKLERQEEGLKSWIDERIDKSEMKSARQFEIIENRFATQDRRTDSLETGFGRVESSLTKRIDFLIEQKTDVEGRSRRLER